MSVHPRQVTPSLLQVNSVLARLTGSEAAIEVCRFLRGEFPQYRWIGVYRIDGGSFRLEGSDGATIDPAPDGPIDGTTLGRAAETGQPVLLSDLATDGAEPGRVAGVRSRVTVPIRVGPGVAGAIVAESSSFAPLDASDARFLEQVAGKLAPRLASG
jgi:putative methionine-R-sulfoxide reductase with GAF domain